MVRAIDRKGANGRKCNQTACWSNARGGVAAGERCVHFDRLDQFRSASRLKALIAVNAVNLSAPYDLPMSGLRIVVSSSTLRMIESVNVYDCIGHF
jgi:hypothetical protein